MFLQTLYVKYVGLRCQCLPFREFVSTTYSMKYRSVCAWLSPSGSKPGVSNASRSSANVWISCPLGSLDSKHHSRRHTNGASSSSANQFKTRLISPSMIRQTVKKQVLQGNWLAKMRLRLALQKNSVCLHPPANKPAPWISVFGNITLHSEEQRTTNQTLSNLPPPSNELMKLK